MVNTKTKGGGAIIPSHIAVKRKATGLTEYYEVRQTPAGPMNIPITQEEYDEKTGGPAPTVAEVVGEAKRITEYAVMEAGAYNLTGDWYPTKAAAEKAIKALGAAAPLHQVVEISFDDLEGHIPFLLSQSQKLRLEEADVLAAEEADGVLAIAEKKHPGKSIGDLSHDEKVALANQYHAAKRGAAKATPEEE